MNIEMYDSIYTLGYTCLKILQNGNLISNKSISSAIDDFSIEYRDVMGTDCDCIEIILHLLSQGG